MEKLVQHFKEHNLRPSQQRMAVMKYLLDHHTHPTAETIYAALSPNYPTLSRTTVYQTLEKLYATGLAQKIVIEDGEMRFDADTSDHGHFKCVKCGEVFDFFYPKNHPFPKMGGPFEIQEKHLYYKGFCPKCKSA
jgi:Fur family transcriptional regulator, peroxide stress response regulator